MIKRLFSKSKPAPEQPAPTPEKTPYEIIGGEAGTRAIANRFYDIMASDEHVKPLYDMHPLPLDRIRQVFFEFLSGWLGGPNLFTEKHGQPMLRKRHMPFTINKDLRDQWNPIRVLHEAYRLTGLANTGPIPPLLSNISYEQANTVEPVAKALLDYEDSI